MNKKVFLVIIALLVLVVSCGKKEEVAKETKKKTEVKEEKKEEKIKIVDLKSNSRPYAVVINNYPGAVKVQTGLNDAYMVYEFPVEGGMTRSVAFFKDKKTEKIGTVRSARHNFLDYIMENDAIFVHFGWSVHAEIEIPQLGINNINGLYDAPFWRENPEGLASEHTAYTGIPKCENVAKNKGYRLTTDVKPVLNYTSKEVDLSKYDDSIVANSIELPYSYVYNVKYVYDNENKTYDRYVNEKKHTDYFSKQDFKTKNILILKIDLSTTITNYYLELHNIGSGKGYYITNGIAREIKWEKKDRKSKTIYKYNDGTELKVNDGNTYIMFHSNSEKIKIS